MKSILILITLLSCSYSLAANSKDLQCSTVTYDLTEGFQTTNDNPEDRMECIAQACNTNQVKYFGDITSELTNSCNQLTNNINENDLSDDSWGTGSDDETGENPY